VIVNVYALSCFFGDHERDYDSIALERKKESVERIVRMTRIPVYKSEALIVGTSNQLHAKSIPSSVSVAGTDLPAADDMKVLGVVLDRRLSCDHHATSVARACNFHAPTHPPSANDGCGAHRGTQPHTVSAGLLQRCVARCPRQQHLKATARSAHRGTNRSAGSATVAVSTTPRTVTLAASSPTH